jgi:two-component system, CitB family, response regulator DctR
VIKVVLIEDDPMVQEVNRQFIEKVDGFKVVGAASNGLEGINMVRTLKPELVIIDVYLPQKDGLETLQQIRTEGLRTDIIPITAASDVETVRSFLQQGAFDYIVKPFKFERIKKALENYRSFRKKFEEKETVSQQELDEIFFRKEQDELIDLPKGLHALTLTKIKKFLAETEVPISAEKVAEGVGIARVTARRYLEYLEKRGHVQIDIQYGGIGRPINRYKLKK